MTGRHDSNAADDPRRADVAPEPQTPEVDVREEVSAPTPEPDRTDGPGGPGVPEEPEASGANEEPEPSEEPEPNDVDAQDPPRPGVPGDPVSARPAVDSAPVEPGPEPGPEAAADTPGSTETAADSTDDERGHGADATMDGGGGWATLARGLRPRLTGTQVVVGLLCAVLGFALVAQVSLTEEDRLSSLRQSDLVRLLDEVTQRSGALADQVRDLEATRDELASGSGRQRAALELAEQQAQTQGILSGRLPAQGPGVTIDVDAAPLDAFALFNILEELRNAGAEAIEVNGIRLVASSYFEDRDGGIVVDGQPIAPPYRWVAVGDSSTIATALEIPGGAMASARAAGARTVVTEEVNVEVTATTEPAAPEYATPVSPEAGDGQ